MIFKRREKPSIWNRLREFVYPRKGFWRGVDYIHKRVRRLPDSPHRIALGFACGAFVSFTPFFGFHFVLASLLAWLLRANIIAALFGTGVGNPFTFPFISAVSLWLGRWMLGRHWQGSDFEAVAHGFGEAFNGLWMTIKSWFGGPPPAHGMQMFLDDVFLPYLIGGILPGLVTAAACYWLIGPLVAAYQERRRRRLAERVRQRLAAQAEMRAYAAHDQREGDNA